MSALQGAGRAPFARLRRAPALAVRRRRRRGHQAGPAPRRDGAPGRLAPGPRRWLSRLLRAREPVEVRGRDCGCDGRLRASQPAGEGGPRYWTERRDERRDRKCSRHDPCQWAAEGQRRRDGAGAGAPGVDRARRSRAAARCAARPPRGWIGPRQDAPRGALQCDLALRRRDTAGRAPAADVLGPAFSSGQAAVTL